MSAYRPDVEVLRAMIRKAFEKLRVAEHDLAHGFAGDASSRAYYAAFHAVSAVLAERSMVFSSHAHVLGAFNREFVKAGSFSADAFRTLQRLFDDRQSADYNWTVDIDHETAGRDVEDARTIVEACCSHLENRTGQGLREEPGSGR